MKRMLSLLLALVMILGVLPMAALAEETTAKPVVHLTADKESVVAGQEVTLTLALDGDISGTVAGWEWDFIYDSAYFTITSSTVGDAAQPLVPDMPELAVEPIVNYHPQNNVVKDTYLYASVTSGNSLTAHYLKKGTIATLTLKAKEEVAENLSSKFYFVPINVMDKNGKILDVVDADAATNWGKADFLAGNMPADEVGVPITITKPLDPINITVYYAANGEIVKGKTDTLLNYAPVMVTDKDGDGKMTISDGFACFHDTYHTAGSAGYADNDSGWVTKFWSVDNPMTSYGRNNGWASGTAEAIADGDSLCLFTYQDTTGWSDLFAYFDSLTATATAQEAKSFHVDGISFMQSSKDNAVKAAPQGATVTATCDGQENLTATVDEEGNFSLTFPAAGEWTVMVNGTCNYTPVGGTSDAPITGAPVVPAQMTVTVGENTNPPVGPDQPVEPPVDPDQPVVEAGYTVTMSADKTAVVGETVEIKPVVGHTDEKILTYNAFDMSFTYDPAALDPPSTTIEGFTVVCDNGTIRVQGYGEDRAVGTAPFTLTFKAKQTGSSDVTLTSAKVDISGNAIDKDAPEATISDASTTVTVDGYSVELPDNFAGAATAEPGKDYTFSEPKDYYDYDVTVKVDGQEVTPTVGEDGSYTIPGDKVTGPIEVTAEKTGKKFTVTLGTDMTGAKEAQYMVNYTAELNKLDGFDYDVSVTIDGKAYTGYTVSGSSYTIPGEAITGDIVFKVTRTAQSGTTFSVTFEGSGAGDATGNTSVTPGASYSFKLNKVAGYDYEVTATMGGAEASYTEADGTYTFDQVTGKLVITITKTLHLEVEVAKYVELDGKTVALITATATLGENQALTYDGNAMFYSDGSDSTEEKSTGYNAWCYLVIVEGKALPTAEDVADKIVATETTYTTLAKTQDVNESGVVDINDAQLVYDIYNGKYEDFATVTMRKFLNADVNHDRSVNVTDAAAVVAAIQ